MSAIIELSSGHCSGATRRNKICRVVSTLKGFVIYKENIKMTGVGGGCVYMIPFGVISKRSILETPFRTVLLYQHSFKNKNNPEENGEERKYKNTNYDYLWMVGFQTIFFLLVFSCSKQKFFKIQINTSRKIENHLYPQYQRFQIPSKFIILI